MNFLINKICLNLDPIIIHGYIDRYRCKYLNNCISVIEVTRTCYLGVIFDNSQLNLHSQNLAEKLRAITYKLYKLWGLVNKHSKRVIYFALYQSIYKYRLLVWGGLIESSIS